ncbi:MAG: hypothetical protein HY867_14800 [Chloroflexi bacterium]|nr:hypothetical protein [Chloroflexota bacterium]
MKRLFEFATDTLDVLNLLQRHGNMTQLLIILYSAIDTMAWVGLPSGDITRKGFKDWVNHYLLPGTPLQCTADDLYSARCGILHSHTSESSDTSKGAARQIWYYGKEKSKKYIFDQIGNRTDVVAVRVVDLILAFGDGAFRHIEDIAKDSEKSKIALERATKWLGWISFESQDNDSINS